MNKLLLFLTLLCVMTYAGAQEQKFPDQWLGTYSGEMLMVRATSAKVDTVALLFEFLKTEKPDIWIYRMTYNSKRFGKTVKDYLLLKPDSLPASQYLLDEQDGIFILMVQSGNGLYSNFSVGEQFLTTIMRKECDQLHYEIVVMNEKSTYSSKNSAKEGEQVYQVNSFPPYAWQIAKLKKISVDKNKNTRKGKSRGFVFQVR